MPAKPADIARYTRDGVAVLFKDTVLKAAQPDAIDAGEIPTFFRYEADATAMLTERASILSRVGGAHEGVEVDEALGVGTRIAVTPTVPTFAAINDSLGLDFAGRTCSVSFDMTIDRYSLELVD